MHLKISNGKKSLSPLFYFCAFCVFSVFCTFGAFGTCIIFFVKKNNNKEFKTVLTTSFLLLLNFQLSQPFSIITILFNYHNPFKLSKSFSVITIFFNIFTTCDTILMKINQRTNSNHLTHIVYHQNMTRIFCQCHKFLIYAFCFVIFILCLIFVSLNKISLNLSNSAFAILTHFAVLYSLPSFFFFS